MLSYADVYDWETKLICGDRKDEVDFWQKLAEKSGRYILELGAGTGWMTIPLLKSGYNITALDHSAEMLSQLQNKYSGTKSGGELKILLADMKAFFSDYSYDLCFFPYSSFQFLLTHEAQLNCLSRVYQQLKPGGVICLDLDNKIIAEPAELASTLLYSEFCDELKAEITMFTSWKTDIEKLIRYWEDGYTLRFLEGGSWQFKNHIRLKAVNYLEIANLLEYIGYTIMVTYGNYFYEKYDPLLSNRLIIIANK